MTNIIKNLLSGKTGNHILPFFWQHGEDEAVLRDYMRAIHESGCGSVCVESRPHPDFCGPKWWTDMDVILDEARKRDMKVWILDDAHFPTGYANGAVEKAPQELCRQSICANKVILDETEQTVTLNLAGMIPPPFTPNMFESYVLPSLPKPRHYDDDEILHVSAFCQDTGENVDLTSFVMNNTLTWGKPKGSWSIWVVGLSRNCGPHRNYINMTVKESCRLLIDAVYEPHWKKYKDYFGKTIVGFFSDEPELGNGHLYDNEAYLGTDQDLPFGREMPDELKKRLGDNWASLMYLLWENSADANEKARVRYAYMDAVTSLVERNFSWQIGDWCREHGVMYIGHVIEDNGAHARTASSLGHFFRGLSGQDMSGIDDIGGQVYPQGEDDNSRDMMGRERGAGFFHFMLGRLASSAAAIEPLKKGRAMCEIFGNYGWAAGVQLMKYLADHFMSRGVNYYVPHAFSPKEFPDPDCPPHFYAHGNNPQFRHFGELIRYMNRVCTLISGGPRVSEAAILYHAESEWMGERMPGEKPARILEENQIGFNFVPADAFTDSERYKLPAYKALILPAAQFYPQALERTGLPKINVEPLDTLACRLRGMGIGEVTVSPASTYLRVLHTEPGHYFIVNEAAAIYTGTVTVSNIGSCYAYNAWDNRLEYIKSEPCENGTRLSVTIEPRKSIFVVFGEPCGTLYEPVIERGGEIPLSDWTRAVCESKEYPAFGEAKPVTLPDKLAEELPEFSGFVRYKTSFKTESTDGLVLVIDDAAEGVEVFVNGKSAGIQIVPVYRFDISAFAKPGDNELVIEVATTLERKCYPMLDRMRKMMARVPCAGSGLTGTVKLYKGNVK